MDLPPFELSAAPYPGLRPFRASESDVFFGREKQTDELLRRLSQHRFLAITGPSGCGKSSLVKAGLLSALNAGFLVAAGSRWRVCQMRPGDRPLARLAHCLSTAEVLGPDRATPEALPFVEAALRRGPLGLAEVVGESEALKETNLLVLVDQFEEIFRYREQSDPAEADAFVELLLSSALRTDLPIYVVITMRSDYLGDCAVFHGLPEAINDGQYLTPRLTREECRAAIVGPARVFGGLVEEPLVNRLLNDFGPDPDQLPLLQHALMRMWNLASARSETPEGIRLTADDYEQIGGLAQALSRHADEALAELDREQRWIAQVLFRRLTERRRGKRDTRAPSRLSEVAAVAGVAAGAVDAVVEVFRRPERAFIAEPGGEVLDISHESLIRQWTTLSNWVEREAESAVMYRRLGETARLWHEGKAGLWGEPDVGHALRWREREKPTAAWAERYGSPGEFSLAMEFLRQSEEAWNREQREEARERQRDLRRTRLVAMISIAVAGMLLALGIDYYTRNMGESVSYYAAVTKVWGGPEGIGAQLSREDVGHRAMSFELTRRGTRGKVFRMRAVDSALQPTGEHRIGTYFQNQSDQRPEEVAVRWEYNRDSEGRVTSETAYDKEKPLWIFLYLPSNGSRSERSGIYLTPDGFPRPGHRYIVSIAYTPEGYESRVLYRNRLGEPAPGRDDAFGAEYVWDSDGNSVEEWSLGPNGRRMNDKVGNSGLRCTHDPRGNALACTAFDAEGHPTYVNEGWSTARQTWDAYGRLTSQAFFNPDGAPIRNSAGLHRIRYQYDSGGHCTRSDREDEQGRPTAAWSDGCYGTTAEYDTQGNQIRTRCINPDGTPALGSDGTSGASMLHDERGRTVSASFEGVDGGMVPGKEGYCRWTAEYGPNGGARNRFYDCAGKPAAGVKGYAQVAETRNARGLVTSTSYYDTEGRPFVTTDGYSTRVNEYDVEGDLIGTKYFGPDGGPTVRRGGYAEYRARYDAEGHEVETEYLDVNGGRSLGDDGYAGARKEYDSMGHLQRLTYLGAMGEPTLNADGVAGWTSRFDPFGHEIERTYLGLGGAPAMHRFGYARFVKDYDEMGQVLREAFFDVEGRAATLRPKPSDDQGLSGYASATYNYAQRGRRSEEAYFDAYGYPTLVGKGYARVVHTYDARGYENAVAYFGVADEPAVIKDGYHRVKYEKDVMDNFTDAQYFWVDGARATNTEGASRLRRSYDQYGRLKEELPFDEHDQPARSASAGYRYEYDSRGRISDYLRLGPGGPAANVNGCYRIHVERDEVGNIIRSSCLGSNGELVKSKQTGCAVVEHRYDENGNELMEACRGADGALTPSADGDAVSTFAYDARGNKIRVDFFDKANRSMVSPTEGYAGSRAEYDALGNQIRVTYVGTDGAPMLLPGREGRVGGYASFRNRYDQFGHAIETTYWGANGQAVMNSDGYHRITAKYRFDQQEEEQATYGIGGKLVVSSLKCARIESRYDDHGRRVEIATFDADNQPTETKYGYARLTYRYDDKGQLVLQEYRGKDGELISIGGTASARFRYDEAGNKTQEDFFGVDNKPSGGDNGVARILYRYDNRRRKIEERYFDESGAPARVALFGQAMTQYRYDERGNLVEESYMDEHRQRVAGFHDGHLCSAWVAAYRGDQQTSSKCLEPQ